VTFAFSFDDIQSAIDCVGEWLPGIKKDKSFSYAGKRAIKDLGKVPTKSIPSQYGSKQSFPPCVASTSYICVRKADSSASKSSLTECMEETDHADEKRAHKQLRFAMQLISLYWRQRIGFR